jgi:O-antigen polysaccharide polymerase Wzy
MLTTIAGSPNSARTAPATAHRRLVLFGVLNFAFLVAVGIAYAIGGSPNPRLLYLVMLFALCSSPVIDLDGLNGRYSLLGIFLASYFIMFGASDFGALLQGVGTEKSSAILTETEAVILMGGLITAISYRWVVALTAAAKDRPAPQNWSMAAILAVGCLFWGIGTYATYDWYVHIILGNGNEIFRMALQNLGPYKASAYILAQMLQPLGILLIVFAWRTYRSVFMLWLVLAIVVLQVALGFVCDVKSVAMMGGALVMVSYVLLDRRIPMMWVAGAVAYVLLVYPIFVASRGEVHGERGISRAAVAENFGKALQLAIAAKSRVYSGPEHEMTFLERVSMRGMVEIAVERTGRDAPYQNGHTLAPLLAAFIPKVIWPDKPDVPSGQIFNKQFHLTDSDDIFISISYLGELYWNFGWLGVLVGMCACGAILGFIGSRFNLADGKTITRLLVTVVTIKQLIINFEGYISPNYVVWIRSLVGIWVLHLMLARRPVSLPLESSDEHKTLPEALDSLVARPFPNLLG